MTTIRADSFQKYRNTLRCLSEMLHNEALFSIFLEAIRGTTKIIMVFFEKRLLNLFTKSSLEWWRLFNCQTQGSSITASLQFLGRFSLTVPD